MARVRATDQRQTDQLATQYGDNNTSTGQVWKAYFTFFKNLEKYLYFNQKFRVTFVQFFNSKDLSYQYFSNNFDTVTRAWVPEWSCLDWQVAVENWPLAWRRIWPPAAATAAANGWIVLNFQASRKWLNCTQLSGQPQCVSGQCVFCIAFRESLEYWWEDAKLCA